MGIFGAADALELSGHNALPLREWATNGGVSAASYTRSALRARCSMPVTLVVPGLLDLPATALAAVDARAPSSSRLVASSARAASEPDGSIAAACRACGLEKQDDWPLAPPLARAMGIDPGSAY